MARVRRPSPQALSLFRVLVSRPQDWRYGYDLTKEIGISSGSLYPLLIRLADEGLLESEWTPPAWPGRPQRHAYRLTPLGMAHALASLEATPRPSRSGLAPA